MVRQGWKSVTQVSARELVSRRYYPLFLASVFVASLLTAYLLLPPSRQKKRLPGDTDSRFSLLPGRWWAGWPGERGVPLRWAYKRYPLDAEVLSR